MPDLAGIDFFADETLLITFAFAEDFADLYESGDFMVDVFFVGSNVKNYSSPRAFNLLNSFQNEEDLSLGTFGLFFAWNNKTSLASSSGALR